MCGIPIIINCNSNSIINTTTTTTPTTTPTTTTKPLRDVHLCVWDYLLRRRHDSIRAHSTMGTSQSKSGAGSGSVQGHSYNKQGEQPSSGSNLPNESSVDGKQIRPSANMTEVVVCKFDEMNDGDMREVEIGGSKALLVRHKGEYHAVGNKCSHYGAPLSKGVLCKGRVRCPWHGACFDVTTGDIEDFPGLDSLPVCQVEIRGREVVVKADPEQLKSGRRVKVMSRADQSNSNTFILVGGGAASVTCAETLRQEGYKGRILIVTQEPSLPYDRPKLSKVMTTTAEAIGLRNAEFYKNHDIEFMTNTQVTGVNTEEKQVLISSGAVLNYTALLIATGGRPRRLTIPGQDVDNVCVLRTVEDANIIADKSRDKDVVILGTSFIGLEVAAYLQQKARSISVVGRSQVALQNVFGLKIGECISKLHEDKGVKFYYQRAIQELVGENGKLKEAILTDGTVLPADVCVLAVGVQPATEFLQGSGVELSSSGFVSVDKTMKTNVEGVWAAGDITHFPLFVNQDLPSNVQHWQMACQQGRIAGLSMLGKEVALRSVPYFWTVMYGKSLRYTGYGAGYDDVIIHGDLTVPQFAAFFTKGERVVAVASLNFDPIVSQAASLMEQGQTILKTEIAEDPKSWTDRIKHI